MLCQLSYGPRRGGIVPGCVGGLSERSSPSSRSASCLLGLYAADQGGVFWVIAAAAVFLGVWMGELALKLLR